MERWATFDCYGTLVDWNGGIRDELEKLFGVEHADELLDRYHRLEPRIQAATPGVSYREVLTIALEQLAAETGLMLPEGEASALARSLPTWPVFEDVHDGLTHAHERGWRLGILSNTDRDLVDASMDSIGVHFDLAIVAGEIESYKPAHGTGKCSASGSEERTRSGTCTLPRASTTTSPPRPSSGSRRSGSIVSRSRRTRGLRERS